MNKINRREQAKHTASTRVPHKIDLPTDENGIQLPIEKYYAKNIFDFRASSEISGNVKSEMISRYKKGLPLKREHAEIVAKKVTEWAELNGATHFTHWFQPLTGTTAEKHDSFLEFRNGEPIQRLSPSKLMNGEPDASSFPNGGSRTTFEARGYTTWDMTSPIFLIKGENGKTVCIPTAFVSYSGEALDVKTPLLRSINAISEAAKSLLQNCGETEIEEVFVTCGAEQEYFLVDKAFYFQRPDLVLSGRTLLGRNSTKDQQLSDHYFGTIPARVLAFMQELDFELHKLGIPSKTRHNEVAPCQFEIAPVFTDANLAADHNHIIMLKVKEIADKHNFAALLHEKPFQNINGSGKHLNWSMGDNLGRNLLEPGENPETNYKFMTFVAAITEAVYRHAGMLRFSTASISNDCRLGGHEAPPSIISVFLGSVLTNILEAISQGRDTAEFNREFIDLGTNQLAPLLKDNTDRNRTSPFAFTGNRFEFRAVGSKCSIGVPLSVINAAVADVLTDFNEELVTLKESGKDVNECLKIIIGNSYKRSSLIIQNGDGYNQKWIEEAKERGLPNYRNTLEALEVLVDDKQTQFLKRMKIFTENEIITRYNVYLETYLVQSKINLTMMLKLINRNVIPCAIEYKDMILDTMTKSQAMGLSTYCEKEILTKISQKTDLIYEKAVELSQKVDSIEKIEDDKEASTIIVNIMTPIAREIRSLSDDIEAMLPDSIWTLPRYFDMLFVK